MCSVHKGCLCLLTWLCFVCGMGFLHHVSSKLRECKSVRRSSGVRLYKLPVVIGIDAPRNQYQRTPDNDRAAKVGIQI